MVKDMHVLICEDFEPSMQVLRLSMERCAGAQVTMCGTAERGVDTIRERGPYDLILMDVNMPGRGGVRGVRHIRKMEAKRRWAPQLIVVVGHSPQMETAAMEAGADEFLCKRNAVIRPLMAILHRRKLLDVTESQDSTCEGQTRHPSISDQGTPGLPPCSSP